MQRPNWGLMYLIILPLVFALAALASRLFKMGLLKLLRRPPVIQTTSGKSYEDYLESFTAEMRKRSKLLLPACVFITATVTIIDCWHNMLGYRSSLIYHQGFRSDEFDWMNAAYIPTSTHWNLHISPWANLSFYSVALLSQALVICIGLFWISSFWLHSRVFADLMLRSSFGYRFVPFEIDPDHRLGLKPIGFVFSTFLALSLVLQGYIYLHRLQVMQKPIWPFFQEVIKAFKIFDYKSPVETLSSALAAWFPLNGLHQLNPGMILLLVLGPILSVTIAWWPVVRLGHFIDTYRDDLIHRYRSETLRAEAEGANSKIPALKAKIAGLEEACVWPNGYAIGWGTFSILIILAISAIFPAILPIVVVSGALLKGTKFFLKKH